MMKAVVTRALRQIEASAKSGIWEAHHGCAAIAGALLLSQDLVSKDSRPAVEASVHSALGLGHDEARREVLVSRASFAESVLCEVAIGAREPKEIGHDVIYSAYVLRALEVFGIEPWPSLLEGVTTLVRKIKHAGPGWITVNGKNEPRMPSRAAEDIGSNCWATFCQFNRPLAMEVGDMQLGHLLTHGHAIEMLRRFGKDVLIADLELAFRKRVQCLREANQEERSPAPLRSTPIDPRAGRYWQLAGRLGSMHGHALKYAYGFLDVRRGQVSAHDLKAFGRIVWPGEPASAFS